jgi:RHS repeat-associated protein
MEYAYEYDAVGRLTDVRIDGALARHYDYDANGNRVARSGAGSTESCSYDAQDRTTDCGDSHYIYNAVGQLSSRTQSSSSATTTFDYDVMGNLRAVTLSDGRTVEYEIDGGNRRIGKRVGGVRQWGLLYQDQLAPVAQVDAHNGVVSTFIYATRRNVPDYMVKNGHTYRLLVDHLGSVRMVVDVTTGATAQRLDYDEFGVVLFDSSPGLQPFGFAGGLYDADTGLARFGARDYDAATGRWTAKDPILFAGGQENLYTYVNGDPMNRTDPSGLDDTSKCIATCLATSTASSLLTVPVCIAQPELIPVVLLGTELKFAACISVECGFGVKPTDLLPGHHPAPPPDPSTGVCGVDMSC